MAIAFNSFMDFSLFFLGRIIILRNVKSILTILLYLFKIIYNV